MGAGWELVGSERFATCFEADVSADALPRNLCLIGFAPSAGWLVSGSDWSLPADRLERLIRFWDRKLRPRLTDAPFWVICCLWDGWRERTEFSAGYEFVDSPRAGQLEEWTGPPGAIPVLSRQQPVVACFAAHRGDPSALLLPDAHYLHDYHRRLFIRVALARRPWRRKRARAIFCGTDHGETLNQLPPIDPKRPYARRYLQELVAAQQLAVDVHLGGSVSRRAQTAYRLILDVDGAVRTWDAWAWKLRSGSVVLSQDSIWETFFSRQFAAWEHFVPVASDFSDLREKLDWCLANERECRAIACRAAARSAEVYHPARVAELAASAIAQRLFGHLE